MRVSPRVSLMAAGLASTICVLIVGAVLRRKPARPKEEERQIPLDENRCGCCFKPFLLGRGVRCHDCGVRSCRKSCSRWDTADNAWHCLFCHQQRHWLTKNRVEEYAAAIDNGDLQRYFNTAKSQVHTTGVENAATSSGSCPARQTEEENAMETIRDFVEKIVEGLIGSVEDTPIDRLYEHPAYDKLLGKYIEPLVDALTRMETALELSLKDKSSKDSPRMAHTALKGIVEHAVNEARMLPSLGGSEEAGRPPEGMSVTGNGYEDLLATAILNKVIEKFQKEQVDGNSNVLHGKPVSAGENVTILDEGVEDGCSSLEPLSRDDCGGNASCFGHPGSQVEPTVSLMIEERIEEVTTTYASDEESKENDVLSIRNAHRVPFPELGMDIIDPSQESSDESQDEPDSPTAHVDLISPIESWEENWLFQKKRVQTQADPVSMLVPNSSADFKALIGDKDAEDTSDLSECSSAQSDEEIEQELIEAINNVVPRSPNGTDSENGMDDPSEASDDTRRESQMEIVPTQASNLGIENFERTEWNEETNERLDRVEENGHAEIEEKTREVETSSTNGIEDNPKQLEAEGPTIDGEAKEQKTTGSLMDVSEWINEIETKDTPSSKTVEPLTITSANEGSSDLPRTPTSTPTWVFVPDKSFETAGNEGMVSRDASVLNSLECAKMKLMAVNEDTLQQQETSDARPRRDSHTEDIQQESEYTEHYDTATQRHLDSLTKLEASEQTKTTSEENTESKCREAAALAKAESASHSALRNKKSDEELRLATPPRPGTIAEREHKKWENAPPIQNNPYSEENIQKRLWERQYSRRSSDIPGIHTELPKSNGENLDVVLTPHEPDIKRFGRDYYINHTRIPTNEKGRRSVASTSSRPGSSLSQGSSSTGPDQDPQDDTRYRDTEVLLNRSNDVKSKVARWQNNNNNNNNNTTTNTTTGTTIEDKYQSSIRSNDTTNELDKINERHARKLDRMWEEQRMEEILENERKNSKNEVNAKLNNQESYEGVPIVETRRSNTDENPRLIRRIDLKAYGFENEFIVNNEKTRRTVAPRVVNKLDLRSFGYDDGIRRTQSNVQLNSIGRDEYKPRIVRVTNKSNLTRRNDDQSGGNDRCDGIETRASGDNNLTQSNEALNKFDGTCYNGYGLKSAKSVPNIAKYYANAIDPPDDEETTVDYERDAYDHGIARHGSVRSIANHYNQESCSSIDGSENDTDYSVEKEQRSMKSLCQEDFDEMEPLPMPSVKRLAEAFSKQSEIGAMTVSKANKPSNAHKERSWTPEIQIVESPRQMHSLTARSLSRQFREGLRQIPNKVTSPPASHVAMEQSKLLEHQTEVVQARNDTVNDTNVILPGKLKSNIIFWERMQKRS